MVRNAFRLGAALAACSLFVMAPLRAAGPPASVPAPPMFEWLEMIAKAQDESDESVPGLVDINPFTGMPYAAGKLPADIGMAGGPSKIRAAQSVSIDPSKKFVYFGSADHVINGYKLDPVTKHIAADVPGSPYVMPGEVEGLAVDVSGSFLVASISEPSQVRLYSVNRTTGALTLRSTQTVAGDAKRIVFDGFGRFVYVCRRDSGPGKPGGVSVFVLNRATAALTPGAAVPSVEGHDVLTLVADHQGRYLWVSDGTANALQSFRIDGATGALTLLGSGGLSFGYGLGVDPDDAFVYSGFFGIHVARLDGATGALTEVAGSPFATDIWNPLVVAPDSMGRVVYAADIAQNLPSNGVPLHALRLDRATGVLTPAAGSPIDGGESLYWIDVSKRSVLDDAHLGETYSANVAAVEGTPPYTFSIVAGALPAGLTLHGPTGFVSGTPQAVGVATATVRVTDASGLKADRAFSMTVLPPGTPDPPAGAWLTSAALPGFGVKAVIGTVAAHLSTPCGAQLLCLAATSASAADAFVRVSALQPNGYFWPSIARFSTARVRVWIRRNATGVVRAYDLAPAAPAGKALNGAVDRLGFLPRPALDPGVMVGADGSTAAAAPAPPAGSWLTATSLAGFQFKVRFKGSVGGTKFATCSDLALCVAGATKTSAAAFFRVQRGNANGFLWPLAVKLTTDRVEVWVQQTKSSKTLYYDLPVTAATSSVLAGAVDRSGFKP